MTGPQTPMIKGFLARLKFPQLFVLAASLLVLDLIVPDFVPFIDEILLAIGAMVLGSWEKKVAPESGAKPPIKDVTPTVDDKPAN